MEKPARTVYARAELLALAKTPAVQEAAFTLPANCRHLAPAAPSLAAAAPVVSAAAPPVVRHAKPTQASLAVLRQIIPDLEEDEMTNTAPPVMRLTAPPKDTQKWTSLRSQPMVTVQPPPAATATTGSSSSSSGTTGREPKSYVAPVVTQVERDALAQIQRSFVQRMKSSQEPTATAAPAAPCSGGKDASAAAVPTAAPLQQQEQQDVGDNAALLAKLQTISREEEAEAKRLTAGKTFAAAAAAAAGKSAADAPVAAPKPPPIEPSIRPGLGLDLGLGVDLDGAAKTFAAGFGITKTTPGALPSATAAATPAKPSESAAGDAPSAAASRVLAANSPDDGSSTASSPSPPGQYPSGLSAAAKPFTPKPPTAGDNTANFSAFPAHAIGASFNFQAIYSQLGPNRPHHHHASSVVHYAPMLTREEMTAEWEKWWCACGWRFYAQFFAVPMPVAVDRHGKPLMLIPEIMENVHRATAEAAAEGAALAEDGDAYNPSARPLPALLANMGFAVKVVSAQNDDDDEYAANFPALPAIPGADLRPARRRTRGGKRRRGKRGGRAARAVREGHYGPHTGMADEGDFSDGEDEDDSDSGDSDRGGAIGGGHHRYHQHEGQYSGGGGAGDDFLDNDDQSPYEYEPDGYRELRFHTPEGDGDATGRQQQQHQHFAFRMSLQDSPPTIASSTDAITEHQLLADRARYPIDLSRRVQRERQVAHGMRTLGYQVWSRMKVLHLDMPAEVATPIPTRNCSKAVWERSVAAWLQQLFAFDAHVGLVFSDAELLTLPRSHAPEPLPDDLLEEDDPPTSDDDGDDDAGWFANRHWR